MLAASNDSLAFWFKTNSRAVAADPVQGSETSPGDTRIKFLPENVVSPIATAGRLAYYAAQEAAGWVATVLDPETGVARRLGPLDGLVFILGVARLPEATLFLGSSTAVLVRDDGAITGLGLPSAVREAGLEGYIHVEGFAVSGDRVFLARFNDRDVLELRTEPVFEVAGVHQVPDDVSPPKLLRVIDDMHLLLATQYTSPRFGPGGWIFDLGTGEASRLADLAGPAFISPTGPIVVLDDGQPKVVGPDSRARALDLKGYPGLASIAASPDGAVWYYNSRGVGDIVWSDSSGQRSETFALPTILGYTGGGPQDDSGKGRPIEPRVYSIGVRSQVALDNGDLVFAAAGRNAIGIIRSPGR